MKLVILSRAQEYRVALHKMYMELNFFYEPDNFELTSLKLYFCNFNLAKVLSRNLCIVIVEH